MNQHTQRLPKALHLAENVVSSWAHGKPPQGVERAEMSQEQLREALEKVSGKIRSAQMCNPGAVFNLLEEALGALNEVEALATHPEQAKGGDLSFSDVLAAWRAGCAIQYFVRSGYDSDWTDYTNKSEPNEQPSRLSWRVKPEGVGPAASVQANGGERCSTCDGMGFMDGSGNACKVCKGWGCTHHTPAASVSDEQIEELFEEYTNDHDDDGCRLARLSLYRMGFIRFARAILALRPAQPAAPEQAKGGEHVEFRGLADTIEMNRVRRLLESKAVHLSTASIMAIVQAAQPEMAARAIDAAMLAEAPNEGAKK